MACASRLRRFLTFKGRDGCEGVKVTDKELLEWGSIDPQEVARLVSEAFNEMIFSFGCEPCLQTSTEASLRILRIRAAAILPNIKGSRPAMRRLPQVPEKDFACVNPMHKCQTRQYCLGLETVPRILDLQLYISSVCSSDLELFLNPKP